MITRIREVRRARGLTLDDVARRCDPPTTAQTIGRLETGTRTVSVGWLNRIARALEVEAEDLVGGDARADLTVLAVIGPGSAAAPRQNLIVAPPRPEKSKLRYWSAVAWAIIARATNFGAGRSPRTITRKR